MARRRNGMVGVTGSGDPAWRPRAHDDIAPVESARRAGREAAALHDDTTITRAEYDQWHREHCGGEHDR